MQRCSACSCLAAVEAADAPIFWLGLTSLACMWITIIEEDEHLGSLRNLNTSMPLSDMLSTGH